MSDFEKNMVVIRRKYPDREIIPNEPEYPYSNKSIQCHAHTSICAKCGKQRPYLDEKGNPRFEDHCECEVFEARRCRNAARPGFLVCRFHGGGLRGGPSAGRPVTTGANSQYIQELGESAERFKQYLEDPFLMSVRAETALLKDRNAQLVEMRETGAVVAGSKGWEIVVDGLKAIERGAVESGLQMAIEAINSLERDREIYDEIRANSSEIRKLADTERKRENELSLVVRVTALMVLLEQISASFQRIVIENVEDERLQHTLTAAFAAELRGHVSRAVGR